MIDLKSALESARLPEGTVPVCLRGDLVEALEQAEARLDALHEQGENAATDVRMSDRSPLIAGLTDAQRDVDVARDAVTAASLPFRLRGLSRPVWESLVNAHPPRPGDDSDKVLGFNVQSFGVALVRACLIDPAIPDDQSWRDLDAELTFAQYDELVSKAMDLSRRKRDLLPFSSVVSAPTPA